MIEKVCNNESLKKVEITRQQYRQIDFLRLFRLCRNLGLLNRKRKMPIEYDSDDILKNDKNARSACRKLLRSIIVYSFPDHHIKSNNNCYSIELPMHMRKVLSYIYNNVIHFKETDKECREAIAGISSSIDGFIHPLLPNSIKILFSFNTRYRRSYRVAHLSRTGFVFKPQEDFYNCAKACLKYKDNWEKYSDLLIKVAKTYSEKTIKVQDIETTNSLQRRLANAVTHSARNTQSSFNAALQRMMERRNNEV